MSRPGARSIVLAAVAALSVLPAAASAADPPSYNLIANSGFEGTTALDGWGANQATVAQTSGGRSGSSAATVTRQSGLGTGNSWGLVQYANPANPAVPSTQARRTYTATAWVRRPSGSTAPAKLQFTIRERDSQGRSVDDTTTVVALTNQWQRVSVSHTSTTAGQSLAVELVTADNTAGGSFSVDDVAVSTSALPANNVQPDPSFEKPSGSTFVADTSGWQTYSANFASVADTAAPFGQRAAEITTTAADYGAGISSNYPSSVPKSTAGMTYTGRAWLAGNTTGSGGSTVGKTARITVRESTPSYSSVVKSQTSSVVLTGGYQELTASMAATNDGDRIDVYVAIDGAPTANLKFRADGISLTPGAVDPGNVVATSSFEGTAPDNVADWTTFVDTNKAAASIASAAPSSSDPGPALGGDVAVVTNGSGSTASSWYSASEDGSVPFSSKSASYAASAWVAGRGSSIGKTVTLGVREVTPGGTKVGTDTTTDVVLGAGFKRVTATRSATASGNDIQIYLLRPSAATAGEQFLLDGVGLVPAPVTSGGTADATSTCTWSPVFPVSSGRSPNWWAPGCWRPHAASSPFNTPVNLSSHGYQYAGTDPVTTELTKTPPNAILAGEQARSEPNPTFYVTSGGSNPDPMWRVTCSADYVDHNTCPTTESSSSPQIRAPRSIFPAGDATQGEDAHVTVVDASSDVETDIFQANIARMPTSTAPGLIKSAAYDSTAAGAGTFAGTGTLQGGSGVASFSLTSGIIRAQELRDGKINHALAVYVPCADTPVAPAATYNVPDQPCASGSDGLFPNGGPRIGQQMKLDMTKAEISALDIPVWRKAILQALSTYGAYVSDTAPVYCVSNSTGAYRTWGPKSRCNASTERQVQSWGFEFEGPTTYTGPGIDVPDQMAAFGQAAGIVPLDQDGKGANPALSQDTGSETTFDLGAGIDWSRMRMLTP